MKKLFLLSLFVVAMCTNANAQMFSKSAFRKANSKFSMGLMGGSIGLFDDKAMPAIGLNVMWHGIYFDFLGWPRSHEKDTHVGKWDDETSIGVHAGYQLPVTSHFRLIPIIGYASSSSGTTNGYNWHVGSGGITNSYSKDDEAAGFDYGVVFMFNIKHLNLFATATRYSVYGGVGFEF